MKVVSRFFISSLFALIAFPALAQTTDPSVVSQDSKLMGQDLSVQHSDGATADQQGVNSTTQVKLLGRTSTVMQATLQQIVLPTPPPTSLPTDPTALANEGAISGSGTSGTTTATTSGTPVPATGTSTLGNEALDAAEAASSMYIAGKRVWTGTFAQQGQSLVYTGGIAPTQIPIPLLVYPVGPLILEVDAGVDYVANLVASLTPPAGILSSASPSPSSTFTLPSHLNNTLGVISAATAIVGDLATPSTNPISSASLNVSATGSAYVEGYAKLLFVRAGIGGAIVVIDGQALVAAEFFEQAAPQLQYNGEITLLSGHIYAFLDTSILFGWTRLWSHDFFNFPGKCFAFGGNACGIN